MFDENKLNEFIANLRRRPTESTMLNGSPINFEAWTNYEKTLAASGCVKPKCILIWLKLVLIGTLAEGELDHKLENDKVDVKFVQIPYTSIPDSIN